MKGRVLPTGTVTFLFSDMEGSTRLVQQVGPATFTRVLERHNEILRAAFEGHGGIERGTQGDSFLVMFAEAPAAVAAAADAQTALAAEVWPHGIDVRVRMGLHTGVGTLGGDDYVGIDVSRASRVASAANGGQVLLSDATRALTAQAMPPRVRLRDLGEHKLKDLARPEHLFELVLVDVPVDFPPIRTPEGRPGNLPRRFTSFIGRDADLASLRGLLRSNRLVTLTGAGGSGKTSLAIELARVAETDFPDGAWFVPVDAVADPDVVGSAIAIGLGLIESPGTSAMDRLIGFLGDRRVLLVIDNFEQVLAAAPFLDDLTRAASGLTMLVTSRAPLRLSIEQEYPVAPLAVPGPVDPVEEAMGSPAVRLFVERARRVRPAFELTSSDAPAVAEICTRLDGLPLGIELAASRIGLLTPRSIAGRLAQRLDLPGTGPRDMPERQRNLERAIAWSHDLLEPAEQRLLARLSVFVGGCRLEEAEAVCGPSTELGMDVIEGLSQLVAHGLVQPIPGPEGARYRLLETVRMFARERLAEGADLATIERRHSSAYLAFAEDAASHMMASGQAIWLDRFGAEHDNLRAAIQWSMVREVEMALRLGAACWRFWQQRGHMVEGLATIDAVLSLPGAEAPSLARVHALDAAGGLRWWTADPPAAEALYRAQLALSRELGDKQAIADAISNLLFPATVLERNPEELQRLQHEAIALYTTIGDERGQERVRLASAFRTLMDPNASPATDALLGFLARFEALDDQPYVSMTTLALTGISFRTGDTEGAFRWALRTIESSMALGDVISAIAGMRLASHLLLWMSRNREAVVANAAFEALCARYAIRPPADPEEWGALSAMSAEAMAPLADEAYAAEARRGASMTIEEAVDYLRYVVEDRAGPSIGSSPPAGRPATTGSFRREGDVWAITYEDRTFRIRDSKGLRYLAQLLAAPGREVGAIDLAAAGGSGNGGVEAGVAAEAGLASAAGTTDPLLDSAARGAYRDRLRDLQEEMDEADRFGDGERASRARKEFEFLARELTIATGLGGRDRRAPSDAERARQSVSKAIRQTLARIEKHDHALSAHLRHSVRLGAFCGYLPDPRSEVRWTT